MSRQGGCREAGFMDDPTGGGGGVNGAEYNLTGMPPTSLSTNLAAESKRRRRGISICRSISHDSQGRKEKARVAE